MFLNLLANKREVSYKIYYKQAVIFQEIAKRLLERLAIIKIQPRTGLDLSMGISYTASTLSKQYPEAQMIVAAEDYFALDYMRKRKLLKSSDGAIVCANFSKIPLAQQSMDLIVANLSLPWCANPVGFFTEVKRLLKPGGLFIFSSLGPDTLKELTGYLQQSADLAIKDGLVDMHVIGDELMQTGFSEPVMEAELLQVNYKNFNKLLEELKVLKLLNSSSAMLGRPVNNFSITLELVYGHAWQPEPFIKPDGHEVYIPIEKIVRRS